MSLLHKCCKFVFWFFFFDSKAQYIALIKTINRITKVQLKLRGGEIIIIIQNNMLKQIKFTDFQIVPVSAFHEQLIKNQDFTLLFAQYLIVLLSGMSEKVAVELCAQLLYVIAINIMREVDVAMYTSPSEVHAQVTY